MYFVSIYRPPVEGEAFHVFLDKFEALLSWLHLKNHLYFIAGDLNVDFLDLQCQKTIALKNLLDSFKVAPVFHDIPSRVTKTTSTLIDNCFTNIPVNSATTYDFGLSDHLGQIVSLDLQRLAEHNETPAPRYRLWSQTNKINLGSLLVYLFSILTICTDNLSNIFENFNKQIYEAIEKCCPLKTGKSTVHSKKIKYDDKINKLHEDKKYYFQMYKQTGLRKFKKAWNRASKNLVRELYRQKRIHNDSEIFRSKNRARTVWNIINSETRSPSKNHIDSILLNNVEIFDPQKIADEFNCYFSTIGSDSSSTVSHAFALKILKNCYPAPSHEFKFHEINLEQLYSVIVNLKQNRSDKNGNVPPFVFRDYFSTIGKPLLSLINACLTEGTFPDFMKIGTITPLFKKGNKKLISNYRPITVLPTVSKIFEKVIYLQLNNYFESNNLITNKQFGFRQRTSTVHAVQQLIENIFKAFESKLPTLSLHFDLAKAFDSIDHELLLMKLKFYGLNEKAMKLMSSYLSNRKQIVKLNTPYGDYFSEDCTVKSGVPQGSVLGPFLFNVFVSDLPKYVDFPTYLYADDTSAILSGDEVFSSVKTLYNQVSYWFKVNGLKLNENKSQALCYTPSAHVNPPLDKIQLNDCTEIKCSDSTRFLGIHIDNHLSWKMHIDVTISKIQSQKWALRNLVKITSEQVALLFYHAHIMSHLRYGVVLWGRSLHADSLFVEQKKIIRILFNLPFNFSCKDIFKKYNLLTLPSIYILESLKFAVLNKIIQLEDLFPSHSYYTRHNFITPQLSHYSVSKSNLKNSVIQIFNALPLSLKNLLKTGQIDQFFSKLETFVLENAFYSVDDLI